MTKKGRSRFCLGFCLLLGLVAVFLLWNLNAGSVAISPGEIWKILLGHGEDETKWNIICSIRLPRLLSALILGGALSVSGYLLQTFFHNPIAGPFVLGISSGAKLMVALALIFVLRQHRMASAAFLILAAFAGAMLSMAFVLLMARRVRGMSMLVISGMMIGYICSAITDFVVTFASDADIVNLHNWSMGSFSGMSWDNVRVMTAVVAAAGVGSFLLAKPIGAFQMGEDYAQSVGVPLKALRYLLVLLSSLLSACVAAFAGPVSFVGIAVPYLMRALFQTNAPIVLIPACFLGGALCCQVCDMIARTVFAPTELSISTVTAIFGAPIVLVMMVRRRRDGL